MSGESKGVKDHGKSVELTKILPECSACVGSVDIRVNSLSSGTNFIESEILVLTLPPKCSARSVLHDPLLSSSSLLSLSEHGVNPGTLFDNQSAQFTPGKRHPHVLMYRP